MGMNFAAATKSSQVVRPEHLRYKERKRESQRGERETRRAVNEEKRAHRERKRRRWKSSDAVICVSALGVRRVDAAIIIYRRKILSHRRRQ